MTAPGQVYGAGIDLVENDRLAAVAGRWGGRFLDRVFLPGERAYCEAQAAPARHYAGRFAVKEAVTKAFGTGIGPHLGWLDMEVVRGDSGAPTVRLSDRAAAWARARGVGRILVSLSHTRHYAVAQALLLGAPGAEAAP